MPDSTRRVKRHPGGKNPCRSAQRLTRRTEPGNSATKPGQSPETPSTTRIPMITTPIPHTNVKNGQPPLHNPRPFMDDTGRPLKRPRDARPSDCRCRTKAETRSERESRAPAIAVWSLKAASVLTIASAATSGSFDRARRDSGFDRLGCVARCVSRRVVCDEHAWCANRCAVRGA